MVWINHRTAVAQSTEFLFININETRDRDAFCFQDAEALPGNPSSAPDPNLACQFHLMLEPARQIGALDAVKCIRPVSLLSARDAGWHIIPNQEFGIDLSELDAGIHPPKPKFIVFGKITRFVPTVLLHQHTPKHDTRM